MKEEPRIVVLTNSIDSDVKSSWSKINKIDLNFEMYFAIFLVHRTFSLELNRSNMGLVFHFFCLQTRMKLRLRLFIWLSFVVVMNFMIRRTHWICFKIRKNHFKDFQFCRVWDIFERWLSYLLFSHVFFFHWKKLLKFSNSYRRFAPRFLSLNKQYLLSAGTTLSR